MDIYKCPKMKFRNTFGKKKLEKLYNKFPKQLKENYPSFKIKIKT